MQQKDVPSSPGSVVHCIAAWQVGNAHAKAGLMAQVGMAISSFGCSLIACVRLLLLAAGSPGGLTADTGWFIQLSSRQLVRLSYNRFPPPSHPIPANFDCLSD